MKAFVEHEREPAFRTPEGAVRDELLRRIRSREARIGVVGLGYVGLPLALAFSHHGFTTVGFETDPVKVATLTLGRSHIGDVADGEVFAQLAARRFAATTDFGRLAECDCIVICVPTPVNASGEPDLSFIQSAIAQVKKALRPGQLVVLESTTYPGCTDEMLLPDLLDTGLQLDADILVAFSPERIDPGNHAYTTETIPRIVGGCSAHSTETAQALYSQVTTGVCAVSSARIAETAKLLENTFRAVNIGLVNEMAVMCRQMDIDIWDVIDAAKTKPYGFMPFYPGPGVGGHCIPLDPAYLAWRGRQFGCSSRFIDAAQQINGGMPEYVVRMIARALNDEAKPLNGARILALGVTYKKDVADLRESPALRIMRSLIDAKARVSYYDPFASRLDMAACVELSDALLEQTDCVVVLTDHSGVDYRRIAASARLIVDTRNAIPRDARGARVVRL